MQVLAGINGTIAAESAAIYAMVYAKAQEYTLVLFHMPNAKDNREDVASSMKRLETLASAQEVALEQIFFENGSFKQLREYLHRNYVDIIFCATRKARSFINRSFSKKLLSLQTGLDVAVVRVVRVTEVRDVATMMLSIKEDRLGVKKFTFFSMLASAFEADAQLYSISNVSKRKLAFLSLGNVKEKLSQINHSLRHYLKLSAFMPYNLVIKHDFSEDEVESILYNIATTRTDLAVVGAKRLEGRWFCFKEAPLERLMRETSANLIALYTQEN